MCWPPEQRRMCLEEQVRVGSEQGGEAQAGALSVELQAI